MNVLDENSLEAMLNKMSLGGGCRTDLCFSVGSPCWSLCIRCFRPMSAQLDEALRDCGEEFFIKCSKFHQVQDHPLAVEAAVFKEKNQHERIAELEAKVKELELKISPK